VSELDGQAYNVTVTFSKSINESDNELYTFYSIFFKNLMRKINFERIGRNCYNPKQATFLTQHNLEVWPGFYSAMQKLESGPLMMIDLTSKVIRKDKVYDHLVSLMDKGVSNDDINFQMKNSVVVTSYGNSKKTYRIERIDFARSPMDEFILTKPDNKTTTF
jgi:aubergine-like protein